MFDRFATPGMCANIYANGTVESTNSALHTARCVWNNLSCRKNRMPTGLSLKQTKNAHNTSVVPS